MDEKISVDELRANKKPVDANTSPTGSVSAATTRRRILQAGAGLAAAAVGASRGLAAPTIAGQSVVVPRAPNIVVIMTDQERHHMHWPAGWAEQNLPSLQRLKRNGLYFLRAYTAACECSPSRGVIQTGRFAPINRVPSTAVLWPGLVHQDHQPTIASLLKAHAGYDVVWKGKWHLSYASNAAPGNGGEDWGPADIKVMEANWGWSGWNPPDAGTAIQEAQGLRSASSTGTTRPAAATRITTVDMFPGLSMRRPARYPGWAGKASSSSCKAAKDRPTHSACSCRWSIRMTSEPTRAT
jgi:Sulfatase